MAVYIDLIQFDKTTYNPGDAITATVTYSQTSVQQGKGNVQYSLVVTGTDAVTNDNQDVAGYFTVDTGSGTTPDPVGITAQDDRQPAGSWVLQSNTIDPTPLSDGSYKGTAVLTSTA